MHIKAIKEVLAHKHFQFSNVTLKVLSLSYQRIKPFKAIVYVAMWSLVTPP